MSDRDAASQKFDGHGIAKNGCGHQPKASAQAPTIKFPYGGSAAAPHPPQAVSTISPQDSSKKI
jgi:hypothetical protein